MGKKFKNIAKGQLLYAKIVNSMVRGNVDFQGLIIDCICRQHHPGSKFTLNYYSSNQEDSIMNKMITLLIFLMIGSEIQAGSPLAKNYVVSKGKTYFCEKLIVGSANTKIFNAVGEVTKIPVHLVDSFRQGNNIFVKLPVISKSNDTIGMAFMQYITSRSGLQLFRYCSKCLQYDPVESIIAPVNQVYRYYVFKGGKFFKILDKENIDSYLSFFGVRVIS